MTIDGSILNDFIVTCEDIDSMYLEPNSRLSLEA